MIMTEQKRRYRPGTAILASVGIAAAILGRRVLRKSSQANLSGNVALITGASSGLGFLIARELAREGCRVAICARNEESLELAKRHLQRDGAEVLAVPCDVADAAQVGQLVSEITSRYGRIDILVNNAGVIQFGPFRSMTKHDFQQSMDIMFWGTVNPTLAVLPQMRERGAGRIVNITSVGGKVSVPHLLPYNSAKFAALGFSEGLHTELKQDGITVTTIVPGLMRTGSFVNAEFKGDVEKEYIWFSLGSSLPLITIDAERAAQQIVKATKRGEAERILSVPAKILARVHGVAPATTTRLLGLVDQYLLPNSPGVQDSPVVGQDVQNRLDSQVLEAATTLGQRAVQQFQPIRKPSERE
jgi:short-subunit dehydrogenase